MDRKHKTSKRLYEVDDFNNLKEMLANTKEKYADRVAFKFKTEVPGKLRTETHGEFIDKINALPVIEETDTKRVCQLLCYCLILYITKLR